MRVPSEANGIPEPGVRQAGWYGKLPAVGDFVTRRLPPDFVEPWDRWLQSGMATARGELGEQWDEIYLTFPVWRFLLPCGLFGDCGWTGVLLPSVDRVGRHFPLTLAAPLEATVRATLGLTDLERTLLAFESTGLLGLDEAPLEEFDAAVSHLALPPGETADASPGLPENLDQMPDGAFSFGGEIGSALARSAGRRLLASTTDRVLWWLPGQPAREGTIRLDRWPLAESAFKQLILQD